MRILSPPSAISAGRNRRRGSGRPSSVESDPGEACAVVRPGVAFGQTALRCALSRIGDHVVYTAAPTNGPAVERVDLADPRAAPPLSSRRSGGTAPRRVPGPAREATSASGSSDGVERDVSGNKSRMNVLVHGAAVDPHRRSDMSVKRLAKRVPERAAAPRRRAPPASPRAPCASKQAAMPRKVSVKRPQESSLPRLTRADRAVSGCSTSAPNSVGPSAARRRAGGCT